MKVEGGDEVFEGGVSSVVGVDCAAVAATGCPRVAQRLGVVSMSTVSLPLPPS